MWVCVCLCFSTIGEHIHTKLPFDLSILAVNLFERDLRRTSKHDCSWLVVTYLFIYLDMPSVRCDCVMIGYRLRKHASNLVTLKAAWAGCLGKTETDTSLWVVFGSVRSRKILCELLFTGSVVKWYPPQVGYLSERVYTLHILHKWKGLKTGQRFDFLGLGLHHKIHIYAPKQIRQAFCGTSKYAVRLKQIILNDHDVVLENTIAITWVNRK